MIFAGFEYDILGDPIDPVNGEGIGGIFIGQGGSSLFMQMLGVVFALVLVLFLAYFVVRILNRARGARSSRNIKIIEGMAVGAQNTIQLIQIGDKFFAIGVSRQGITMIGEISEDSVVIENKVLPPLPFEKHLAQFMGRKKEPKGEAKDEDIRG
jgi:flagellar protein FliO/FliZ